VAPDGGRTIENYVTQPEIKVRTGQTEVVEACSGEERWWSESTAIF
jgi:hypothetical protein